MAKIVELKGENNRWTFSSLGARLVDWEARDGDLWRPICRGDGQSPPSRDRYHGCVMFPWVNRIGGDHWSLEGHVVPVDTSGELTHLHGRLYDATWEVIEQTAGKVAFRALLAPGEFYPRPMECVVGYEVTRTKGAEALQVEIVSKNLSTEWGEVAYVTTGVHPYFLNPFGGKIDEASLMVAAAWEFAVDDRLIPTGLIEVTEEHDFRSSRVIGAAQFDNGFVAAPGASPMVRLNVRNFELTIDPVENCRYVQVYIPPDRSEIAIEPQSGGADAFRHHEYGLRRLDPGESFRFATRIAIKNTKPTTDNRQ